MESPNWSDNDNMWYHGSTFPTIDGASPDPRHSLASDFGLTSPYAPAFQHHAPERSKEAMFYLPHDPMHLESYSLMPTTGAPGQCAIPTHVAPDQYTYLPDDMNRYPEVMDLFAVPAGSGYVHHPHAEHRSSKSSTSSRSGSSVTDESEVDSEPKHRCWDHGCNGRVFSTRGNLIRHQKEKSEARATCVCPKCGAIFSRTTARNQHAAKESCNRIRRYSNGRQRPGPPRLNG